MKTAFSHLVAHTKDVEPVLINSEYGHLFLKSAISYIKWAIFSVPSYFSGK